jgi:hypothetical protein
MSASNTMADSFTHISVKGTPVRVPAVTVQGRTVVVTGRWIRMASVHGIAFTGDALDPRAVKQALVAARIGADVFTFSESLDDVTVSHPYYNEWDNAAIAPADRYDEWWNALPQEARKNVRRAGRRGVEVRQVTLDDALVAGVKALYDETPVRQGRPFWHHGKELEQVRADNSTFLDSSRFIGAYHEGVLIGFMKVVYVGRSAITMQILGSIHHVDKRPMNAMIASAMQMCHADGMARLVYSRFHYGNKGHDSMAEFKRRNGFEEVQFPRYYVPLSPWGRVVIALRLHRGLLGLLPGSVIDVLRKARAATSRRAPAEPTDAAPA